jgi:hypothetical protein
MQLIKDRRIKELRKGLFKFLAILTCVMFLLPLTACVKTDTDEDEKVLPPDPVSAVTNVIIMYDGNKLTGGVLSVDVSLTLQPMYRRREMRTAR